MTKHKINIYTPSEEVRKLVRGQTFVSIPLKLPMIVKPREYSQNKLGGYLLNDEMYTDSIFITKYSTREKSIITKDSMYECINNINSVGYKINKEVLNFLVKSGSDFGMFSTIAPELSKIPKSKLTKTQRRELDSQQSKVDLELNIMGIANVYKNLSEFYLPVRMDSRGRVYCISSYLNYQSTDMAKSLLLFSKGETICKTDSIALQ
jgi:DNA-directed RNA polymerase